MEALFETIFGNILIILAIVGGIVGVITDRKKKENESNKPYSTPIPTSTPTGGYQEVTAEQTKDGMSSPTIGEQLDTPTHRAIKNGKHDAIAKSSLRKPSYGSNKNNGFKKQVNSNLSKQGLVNGVIMSEVLGPPRAKKPYRSFITERRK